MNRIAITLMSSTIALAAACNQPAPAEDPAAAPPPAAEAPAEPVAAAPTPPPAPEPEPDPTAEELPVPEDFLAEAETSIGTKNYKAELAKLDKEMKAEKLPEEP